MVQRNNFGTLRILAALAVVLSHSVPLSYGSNAREPFWRLSGGQTTAGLMSVAGFFVISGYLITQSFVRSGSVRRFVLARAVRLLPGLAVVLMVLAFVIGPIVSTLPMAGYFASAQPYRFVAINLSLVDSAYFLPGVFQTTPWHGAVDGSLWSLPYEGQCYVLVLVLGLCGLLNRAASLALLLAGFAGMALWPGSKPVELYSCFLAGSALYHWQLPLRARLAALAFVACVAALLSGGFVFAEASAGAYLVICLALAPQVRLPDLARWGDLSYGIYIWAFPVQQIAAAGLGAWACWYLNLAISLPAIAVLAWLSWHFVEAPALALKRFAVLAKAGA